MEKFLTKLKVQAQENPILALGAGAGVATAAAQLFNSLSAAQGRRAYAKQVNHRVKHKR